MRNFFFLILKIDHFQQFVHFYSANSFGKSFFSRLFLFARGPEGLECCESLECCCCVVVVSKGKQASDPLVLCGLFFCQPTFFFFCLRLLFLLQGSQNWQLKNRSISIKGDRLLRVSFSFVKKIFPVFCLLRSIHSNRRDALEWRISVPVWILATILSRSLFALLLAVLSSRPV